MFVRTLTLFVLAVALGACAAGGRLRVGQADVAEVIRVLGQPAQEWLDKDGSRQLAFTHGPMGTATEMVFLGTDGRLLRIDNVLTMSTFDKVQPGMDQEAVLRLLGPSEPRWTAYFKARDELVWEWRYCDDWNQLARFDVLFDGSSQRVRSTMSLRESQMGNCGGRIGGSCWCSH